MTLSEMRNLVWTWLSDPQGGYFTSAQVDLWLNNAQKEVQKLVEQAFEGQFQKCVETTMVLNQREYQLPEDFKRTVRLEIVMSGTTFSNETVQRVDKITTNQQDMVYGPVGLPRGYYFKNNQIILVPAPNVQKTLRLTYIYRVPNMTLDADVSEIPLDYHEMMPILATLDGLTQDARDITAMMEKKKQYEEMVKRDAEQRFVDAPRTIVQTQSEDYIGDW